MDRTLFDAACARALLRKSEGGGIGMLGEKSLHSSLKYYYEPDASLHERETLGFIADIRNENGVIEIQTRNLFSMKRKLESFLSEYEVTIVHPVIRRRRLIYLDSDTGELSRPRLSPRKGRTEDAYRELVHIREFIGRPGLHVIVPLVDAEEYRMRGAGKSRRRGGNADLKYELLPTELVSETRLFTPKDHIGLLPERFFENGKLRPFTVSELASELKLARMTASAMCAVMCSCGALTRERKGRAFVYCMEESA